MRWWLLLLTMMAGIQIGNLWLPMSPGTNVMQAITCGLVDSALDPSLQGNLVAKWKAFENQAQKNMNPEKVPYQNLPDFIQGTYCNPNQDVILASHTSIDKEKIQRIDILQRYWQGPISLGVRIRSQADIELFFDYFNQLPTSISSTWTIHFLFEYAPTGTYASDSYAVQYCHNRLRDLALHSNSIPNFVLAVDLDFVPTFGGHPKLMSIMKEHPHLWDRLQNYTLLVVPILEVLHIPDSWGTNASSLAQTLKHSETSNVSNLTLIHSNRSQLVEDLKNLKTYHRGVESDLPKSRSELEILYRHGLARQWHFPAPHLPSDYTRYWSYNNNTSSKQQHQQEHQGGKSGNADTTNSVAAPSPTYRVHPNYVYEPYFIGHKLHMPHYWKSFRGYGLNKQSFVRECLLSGFQMEALYELYLTHLAHPSNRNGEILNVNKDKWIHQFQPYLEEKYEKPEWLKGEYWFDWPGRSAEVSQQKSE